MEKSDSLPTSGCNLVTINVNDVQTAIFSYINEPQSLAKLFMATKQTKFNAVRSLFLQPDKKNSNLIRFILDGWMANPKIINENENYIRELLTTFRYQCVLLEPELYIKAITILAYVSTPSEKIKIFNLLQYFKKR